MCRPASHRTPRAAPSSLGVWGTSRSSSPTAPWNPCGCTRRWLRARDGAGAAVPDAGWATRCRVSLARVGNTASAAAGSRVGASPGPRLGLQMIPPPPGCGAPAKAWAPMGALWVSLKGAEAPEMLSPPTGPRSCCGAGLWAGSPGVGCRGGRGGGPGAAGAGMDPGIKNIPGTDFEPDKITSAVRNVSPRPPAAAPRRSPELPTAPHVSTGPCTRVCMRSSQPMCTRVQHSPAAAAALACPGC